MQLTALSDAYKNDFVLLANESLIKAIECRLDKDKSGVDRAMRQGYILTAYFSEQLPVFEKQEQSMRFFTEDMVNDIDLKKEMARISTINSTPARCSASRNRSPWPARSFRPRPKHSKQAEDLYSSKDSSQREIFS